MRFVESGFGGDTIFSSRALAGCASEDVFQTHPDGQPSVLKSPYAPSNNYGTVVFIRPMAIDTAAEVIEAPKIGENPVSTQVETVNVPDVFVEGTREIVLDPDIPLGIKTVAVYPYRQEDMDRVNTSDVAFPTVSVAEKYLAHQRPIGYLEAEKGGYGGSAVSGTVVGYTGELFFEEDPKRNTTKPMVHTRMYVLKEPGNMALFELAKRNSFREQRNFAGKEEYIIENVISLDSITQYGYVFSDFKEIKEQEFQKAA